MRYTPEEIQHRARVALIAREQHDVRYRLLLTELSVRCFPESPRTIDARIVALAKGDTP